MSIQKQTHLGLVAVVAVIGTALLLGCESGCPRKASTEAPAPVGTAGEAPGKAPPIPKAGPLARPRSLQQVGLPVELTRTVTPTDNPQTPEKIALGQKLFFEGRLSADGTVACATSPNKSNKMAATLFMPSVIPSSKPRRRGRVEAGLWTLWVVRFRRRCAAC